MDTTRIYIFLTQRISVSHTTELNTFTQLHGAQSNAAEQRTQSQLPSGRLRPEVAL
jgi:hypothetical protein